MRLFRPTTEGTFWEGLHGIRGFAVLFVLASHLGQHGLLIGPIPHDSIGKVGVWIFFVLSAFLLTYRLRAALSSTDHRRAAIGKYLVHRLFRIFPLYLFVIGMHWLLDDMTRREAVEHAILIAGHGELWAIPVEFKYYFAIPVIALAAVRFGSRRTIIALLLLFAGSLACSAPNSAALFSNELDLLPRLAPFLIGSALALSFEDGTPRGAFPAIGLLSIIALAAMTVVYRAMFAWGWPVELSPWISLVVSVSVAGLISASFQNNPIARLFRHPWLVFMGEISFSVYLLHMFVVRFALYAGAPLNWMSALAVAIACIVIATVSYYAIERRGIKAGQHLARRLFSATGRGLTSG